MKRKTLTFARGDDRKYVIRYEEQPNPDHGPVLGTIYVQKWALGDNPPAYLVVTLETA